MTQPTPLAKHVCVDTSSVRLAKIWAGVASQLESRPRPLHVAWRWATVSLLVLGVAITTWTLARRGVNQIAWKGTVLETAAQGTAVRLADDSRLVLAHATRVELLRDDDRATAVRVTRGRITCDLPKPRRPFSVFAGEVEVRVTGTRFSVERDPLVGKVDVSVERGSVVVRVAGESTPSRTLRGGETWSTRDRATIVASTSTTSDAGPDTKPPAVPAEPEGPAALAASAEPAASAATEPSDPVGSAAAVSVNGSISPAEVRNDVESAKDLFDRGNQARRAGDAQTAAQAYHTLLSRFPRDGRSGIAALELGRLRMGPLGDPAGAISAFRTASTLLKGSALREDAMARLVEAYSAAGQTVACRTARTEYLRGYPRGVHTESLRRHCGGL